MSSFVRLLITALVSITPCAIAQDNPTPDAERIEQLVADNLALRQELAELRMELAQLRRAHDALLAEHENETAQPHDARPDEDTDEMPAPDDTGDEDIQTFTSADQIFRTIPEDLAPGRDGWDLPQRIAVERWLVDNIPGNRFEARLEIENVTIGYSTVREDWSVSIDFAQREMRFLGWDTKQRIGRIVLHGDRAFADRARRLESGARVNVAGMIASAGWGLVIGQVIDEPWKPSDYRIILEDTQIDSPHLRP